MSHQEVVGQSIKQSFYAVFETESLFSLVLVKSYKLCAKLAYISLTLIGMSYESKKNAYI